jgi:acyl-CoA synthetase (AMP-forming)/AMP-acid ligase II
MRGLDFSCGGLLPLVAPLEARPALCDDRSENWLTREDLRIASLGLAEQIASDRKRLIFVLCGNNSQTVIGLLAAAAAGQAVALIDPSLPADKLKALVEAYEPELVFGTRDVRELLRDLTDASARWRSFESSGGDIEWMARRGGSPSVEINPSLQLILGTSGTTGGRKYVRLSREAIVANAAQIAEALDIGQDSAGIGHLPLHYAYGLSVITSHLAAGSRVYLMTDSIGSPSFWAKISAVGGSHFPGVPFHYAALDAALARLGASVVPDSVTVFTQAGGALSPRVQAEMHELATSRHGRFFVMYGQTEASPRMTTLQHSDFLRKAGSVGAALPGGRLSIVDERGTPLPADSVGAVVYEGPNVMMGYAISRSDLSKGDELKGRLETGDLGRLDPDGFLTLTGRTKRFVKIAGNRLGLDEIENDLSTVCPVACLDFGDQIAVIHEQESETALMSRIKELAGNYRIPASSFSLLRTGRIPRGANGKVDYAQLQDSLGG